MKIEKISDNKIKFVLGPEDLKDRAIDDIRDLTSGSLSSQEFIFDILEEARNKHNIEIEPGLVRMEIKYAPGGDLVLLLTIVKSPEELFERSPFSFDSDECKELSSRLGHEISNSPLSDVLNEIFGFKDKTGIDKQTKQKNTAKSKPATNRSKVPNTIAYEFNELDHVIDAVGRIKDLEITKSSLYKNEKKYVLIMEGTKTAVFNADLYLCEYGHKLTVNYLYETIKNERGEEPIIKDKAIQVLNKWNEASK